MGSYDEIKSYAARHKKMVIEHDCIPEELYKEFDVKRGLRDQNGRGVLTGLTKISEVISQKKVGDKLEPVDGQLWYRGYNVETLVNEYTKGRFAYENLAYLLMFGKLPDAEEAQEFIKCLSAARELPTNFTRDVIMKAPTKDIMNSMTRSILTLASYDRNAMDTGLENVIRQSMNLIAVFPMLAIYGYHAYNHYERLESMYIHRPGENKSTAENILLMLRPDKKYTDIEAKVLDAALMLHMEHGGGNNSTFTTRVVTSSGSDTYATIAAAMSSLKGPKHGGANIKVMEMMKNIRKNVKDYSDEDEIKAYLSKILNGDAFDHTGLIYGIGHAVYSISDPRERIFKSYVTRLAKVKGREEDMTLYSNIEKLAPIVISEQRHIFKGVSPNVDFYSGFVYNMLDIPEELYTPIFAIARIAGWSAHRLEELVGNSKIIRPAYKSVMIEEEGELKNSRYNQDTLTKD